MSHLDRPGALAVSISSTLSFTACLSLGFFIVYLIVRYRGIATENAPSKSGIRFLRTQAGQLFMNLLVADFIQAFGFGSSWIWYSRGHISEKSGACVVQALAIEAGDVASALFSLFIALHTAAFLAGSWKPPALALNLVCTVAWVFTVLITAMGPLAVEKEATGPFYGSAGNWCWITKNYEDERLWLHYLFIFASAIGQLVSYCALFVILRVRVQMERRLDSRAVEEAPSPIRGGYQSPTTIVRPRTSGSTLRRKIDKTSLVMLAYPLVNLTVILPLSIFRLSSLAGRPGSPGTLAGCGVIFSLGGFANVVLYSLTRRLLRLPSATDSSDQHIVTPIRGSIEPKQSFRTLNTPDSDITKVESGPNTPAAGASIAHTKLKELRLSPSRCTLTITRPPVASSAFPTIAATEGGLLPAANIGGPVKYTRSRSPVSNLSQVNVSQETIVRIES